MAVLYLVNMSGNSLTLYKVLNWVEDKKTPIPKKDVYHRAPSSTESSAYSDMPREHLLICRLTSAEKATLYDIENDQEHVQIMETTINHGRCWIDKIEVEYEIVEHAKSPWKVSIFLVECLPPLLDADIDIEISFSDEPPIWTVWHQAFSDEPPIWTVWHPSFSDEPNIHVALHSIFTDEMRVHTGLGSLYVTGDIPFWVSVGYISAT